MKKTNEPSPEQKKFIDQYLDPDGELEIPPELLAVMQPHEVAEADQLLAARFDIAKALMGRGKTYLATAMAVRNITKLDYLLREAQARLDASKK